MMTGVIWFIQLAHYPAYRHIDPASFATYQAHQLVRTGAVVVPLMLVEFVTGAWLAVFPPAQVPPGLLWLGLGLIAVVCLSTILVQAPLHARLIVRRDPELIDRLLRTNWLRTVAWSSRALLVGWLLWLATRS